MARGSMLAGLVFIAAMAVIECKQCYSCTFIEGACKDPFEATQGALVDCPSGSSCWKFKVDDLVSRTCTLNAACFEGSYSQGGQSGVAACCDGDKCNGSGRLFSTSCILAAMFVYLVNMFI